jgi:Zn-dependent protease with chaperone function
MKRVTLLLFIIVYLLGSASFAQAQQRDSLKERQFEQELSRINPRLVPVFHAATMAFDSDNLSMADTLYHKVLAQAPEFNHAYRRIGAIRAAQNDTSAFHYCKKAIELKRSWENLSQLGDCYSILSKKPSEIAEGISLADEAIKLSEGKEGGAYLTKAQLAMSANDLELLGSVANEMLDKFPDKSYSHFIGAVYAANLNDFELAKTRIEEAARLGLDTGIVDNFLVQLAQNNNQYQSEYEYQNQYRAPADTGFLRKFLIVVLVWAGGLFLLFLLGIILSAITVRSVAKPFRSDEEMASGASIRKFYRILINIGGVYYYISLPIVLLMVIALGIGLLYLFLELGRIPIKLMLLIGIGIIVTVFSTIRSIFTRMNSEEPGRQLKQEEAPALFQLTHEVAKKLNTRPIDEIRITEATELAVYERGTWREKLNDSGKRVLILGTGVLKDFRVEDFKAVLAHEYGHFSNRDTAGGGLALRVQKDMHEYYVMLVQTGQAGFWNLSFWFLRLYHFIFRRISLGATRLQEVLADRVAVQSFGGMAFRGGLTHVIKRSIEFHKSADQEINSAKRSRRPFNNLYQLPISNEKEINDELNAVLNSQTTADDSHPSPRDRFKLIEGLNENQMDSQLILVSDLFSDFNGLTQEMTGRLERFLENYQPTTV